MRKQSRTGRFLTAKEAEGQHPTKCFARGFVDGLGSAATITERTATNYRRYEGRGLKGDWSAVGRTIRRALPAD